MCSCQIRLAPAPISAGADLVAEGIEIDRSTLAHWVGIAAFELAPLHDRLLEILKSSTKLFADETRCPVLDPGRGRTKTGYLWAIARDDRPWAGIDPPAVAYRYAPGRGAEHANALLAGFSGVLQVDLNEDGDRRVPSVDRSQAGSVPFCGSWRGGPTTRQYARLVQEWVGSIGLDPTKFGTHSLRRTKAVLIYLRTGNLRAVQLLLGHSKIESTVRHLGIEVDAIEIAEKIDI